MFVFIAFCPVSNNGNTQGCGAIYTKCCTEKCDLCVIRNILDYYVVCWVIKTLKQQAKTNMYKGSQALKSSF